MNEPAIGELDTRVTLRHRYDQPNMANADLESNFPVQKQTWAKLEPVGSALYSGSVQADNILTHRITIRYRNGITRDWEVVVGEGENATVYRVRRSSHLNGKRRFTVLEVEEL